MSRVVVGISLFLVLAVGCDPDPIEDAGTDAGGSDAGEDAGEPDAGFDAGGDPCVGPPGLFEDGSCEIVAAGLRAFTPQYTLWADQATKERYIYLPPGMQIDTSDPDNWVFPVGTRIYKTFSLSGLRLETRLLEKTDLGTGPGVWDMRVWAWNMDQDEVTEVTSAGDPERQNVLGTEHDIPSAVQCAQCHMGTRDTVNGFSAIQLNHASAGVTLEDLITESVLTDAIVLGEAVIPGDATAVSGLGYLHANCGHCHHAPFPVAMPETPTCHTPACNTGLHMWMDIATPTVEASNAYVTAVNELSGFFVSTAPCRIRPGFPDSSAIIARMGARGDIAQMPPIATEMAHAAGIAEVSAWIATLTGADARCTP